MKIIILLSVLILTITNSVNSSNGTHRWLNKSDRYTYSLHRLSDYTGTKNYKITVFNTKGYQMNQLIDRYFADVSPRHKRTDLDDSFKKVKDLINEARENLLEKDVMAQQQKSPVASTTAQESLFY